MQTGNLLHALGRRVLGTPRAGGDRQALSVLLAARRSAVDASTVAQRQLFSLVIAALSTCAPSYADASCPRWSRSPPG
jgi:hypothetical protein